MRLSIISCLALLLACEASVASAKDLHTSPMLHRRQDPWADFARRGPLEHANRRMSRRQSSSSSASAGVPANINSPQINETVSQACLTALSAVHKVPNPAGWAACYNILFLNNQTGIFEADLRTYQVEPPSGTFAGVDSNSIAVALSYPEAEISSVNQKFKRAAVPRQNAAGMPELRQYSFIGKINPSLKLTSMPASDLMALVIPTISLSATSPSTRLEVTTNVSTLSTAYFVTGKFAGQGTAAAGAAAPSAVAAATKEGSTFTLPGKTLGIFPIGLIVTGTWCVLFIGAVSWGTLGRIMARKRFLQQNRIALDGAQQKHVTMYHKAFGAVPNYRIEHLNTRQPNMI